MSSLIRSGRSLIFSRLLNSQSGITRKFATATSESQAEVVEENLQRSEKEIITGKGNASKPVSFAKLLRYSPLVQMGDPNGTIVVGTIIETVGEDIYVDFGAKFHCVCKKPRYKANSYSRGARVKLRLSDLELASKFMGSEHGITLREAEAVLVGLYNEPSQKEDIL